MHRLVADTTFGPRALEEYSTYGEAIAAYAAVDAERSAFPAVKWYAVRSSDDPAWGRMPLHARGDLHNWRTASIAVMGYVRGELAATARTMVAKGGRENLTLAQVQREVTRSLGERGFAVGPSSSSDRTFAPWEVEEAIKSRVIIGRCRRDRRGQGCDRAFWMPKTEGPLHKARCPHCGDRLAQTTLALRASFARLTPAPVAS